MYTANDQTTEVNKFCSERSFPPFNGVLGLSNLSVYFRNRLMPRVPKYRKDSERRKKTRKETKRPGKAHKDPERLRKLAKNKKKKKKKTNKM